MDSTARSGLGDMMAAGFLLLCVFAGVISGCKADPVGDSGFLEKPEMMKNCDVVPVHRIWRDPSMKALDYDKIIVKPVYTQQQLPKNAAETANIRTWLDQEDKDTADFAHYMEDAFKNAIKEGKRVKLTETPGPGTMALELNLVKVIPGKPVLGALKNLSNLLDDFRAYGNPKQIIDEWARQFVQALDKRPFETGAKLEGDSGPEHLIINY